MGISLYNKIPDQIKLRENFNLFKMDLKSFLLNRSFYSVEEFVILNFLICVNVSLSLEIIKILFSLNFITLDTVLILVIEILYAGLSYSCIWYVVTCTQFVYVVKYNSVGDLHIYDRT
jgi:hypothetical protein